MNAESTENTGSTRRGGFAVPVERTRRSIRLLPGEREEVEAMASGRPDGMSMDRWLRSAIDPRGTDWQLWRESAAAGMRVCGLLGPALWEPRRLYTYDASHAAYVAREHGGIDPQVLDLYLTDVICGRVETRSTAVWVTFDLETDLAYRGIAAYMGVGLETVLRWALLQHAPTPLLPGHPRDGVARKRKALVYPEILDLCVHVLD